MSSSRCLPALLVPLALTVACVSSNPKALEPTEDGILRVAACQILVDGDYDAALERIDRSLQLAKSEGAHIAVFPEVCLFGWTNPAAHEHADSIPGPTSERLGSLAREHDIMVVVGLAEKYGDALYNTVVLIDRDGELLLKHRKTNILSELMDPPYVPGESAKHSVVDTRYGRIGLLICANTFKDDIVAQLAESEPDLVLVPYGWAAPADDWPDHGKSLHAWIAATARKTGAPVVGVDAVGEIVTGPWEGYPLGGQSAYSNAEGQLSEPMADREPDVKVFEIDRE